MAGVESTVRWQSQLTSLKGGISHIYETKEFADIILKVSARKFKAHRLIIGARSPKLAAMLVKTNSDYPKELDLTIDGVTEDGFEKLLHYIYTDELLNEDDILETYRTARFFEQKGMMNLCEAIITKETVNIDNVCLLLKQASDIPVMKTRCLDYITNTNAQTVLNSKGFLNLSDENLRELLEEGYFAQVPKMNLLENVLRWGREQFAPQDDYKLVRGLFLLTDKPILGKLGIETLNSAEIAKVVADYKELLTLEESMQFFLHAHNQEASLPVWCVPA